MHSEPQISFHGISLPLSSSSGAKIHSLCTDHCSCAGCADKIEKRSYRLGTVRGDRQDESGRSFRELGGDDTRSLSFVVLVKAGVLSQLSVYVVVSDLILTQIFEVESIGK